MKNKFTDFEIHPAADVFQMLSGADFDELKKSIKEHGQLLPIIRHHGKVLDGRNRLKACCELGVDPIFEDRDEIESPADFVFAMGKRRNLTYDQRVAAAAKYAELKKAEAKERQRAAAVATNTKTLPPKTEEAGEAVEKAAKEMGVGKTAVYEARALEKQVPGTIDAMLEGNLTLAKAKEDSKGKSRAHEGSKVVPPREHDPEDDKSETLWSLNYHWKRATKKEKAAFCQEHGLKPITAKGK